MSSHSYKIGIVVDRNFGGRIPELARSFHIWVVESPDNIAVIHRFWKTERAEPGADPLGPGITSFRAGDLESPEEICARIAGEVDEHHGEFAHAPPWSEIEVYGVALSTRLQDIFTELGANECQPTQDGFMARK